MELLENILEFLKLQGGKTLTESGSKSDWWWTRMWWKLVILFGILIADAELKIHGFDAAVTWSTLVIPIFALLVLGNPTRQVQFSLIWALFVHKDKGVSFKEKFGDGVKEYWTVVGVILLWAFFIPLGIRIVPIEYRPEAFWVFLPAIAAHELAWWRGWHNDQERDFRRWSIAALKWILIACIVLPFVFAAIALPYEHHGVRSTSSAEIDRAAHDNEVLLEARRTECVRQIKARTLEKDISLTKSDLAAMEACKTTYASPDAPDASQNEGVGGAKKSSRPTTTTAKWYEHPIDWAMQNPLTALIVVFTHGLVIWWIRRIRNRNTVAAATATKTVVIEKKKSQGWPFNPVGTLLWALIIWSLVSWFNGGWITNSTDVHHLENNISTIFDKKEIAPERKYPNAFLTPEEIRTWQAVGSSPCYHPHFGEIAGRSFELITGSQSGRRPSLYDRLEGGYGKPLIIMLEENNPSRDVVLENTVCNPPRIYSDNNVHTVCVGKWRSGDRRIGGISELDYSAENRTAILRSPNESGTIETIVFVFQPK